MGDKKLSRLEQEILDAGFPIMMGDGKIVKPEGDDPEEEDED